MANLYGTELAEYPIEYHSILTVDGYVLTLTRIPGRKESESDDLEFQDEDDGLDEKEQITPAVLIVHGVFCAAEHWLINSPHKALPYKLVNKGYDVYLANLRGTPLSRHEGSTGPDDQPVNYWNFSFSEMAYYDIPAMINFILTTTGNTSLYCVGHSTGSMILLTSMTLRPEYCSKVKAIASLAPTVYSKHIRNIYFRLCVSFGNILSKSDYLSSREILTKTSNVSNRTLDSNMFFKRDEIIRRASVIPKSFWRRILESISVTIVRSLCSKIGVFETSHIEEERLAAILKRWPAPTSLKLLCHWIQTSASGIFREYHYGATKNLKIYGQSTPPVFDFSKVNVPVATFCSDSDQLCRTKDIDKLVGELPNSIGVHRITQPKFSHGDFVFGKDANCLVYDKIIEVFSDINKKYV